MVTGSRLERYAKLTVKQGANVQKNQIVIINSSLESAPFTRLLVKEAYEAGARQVIVKWSDDDITKMHYENMSLEDLCDIPAYKVEEALDPLRKGACLISVSSPHPGLLKDVDSRKIAAAQMAGSKAMAETRQYTMANMVQWCIVAASNPIWAKKVFPTLSEEQATAKLWDAIYDSVHVGANNDPIESWKKHTDELIEHIDKMNDYNFSELHFKNALGTDLHVGLVKNHIWAGGCEKTQGGIEFNPNMPTEEIFCMPDKYRVNGVVYSSKPLNYAGKIVDQFWLEFKDGKVVNYHAEKEQDSLKELIEFDEGSSYIGEVALVPFHSPISNSNILFHNTLFDENASCHLALGRAYPMNVKGGTEMSEEELAKTGANISLTHVDFMFGTHDMTIKGIKEDGSEVDVFINGDFVI